MPFSATFDPISVSLCASLWIREDIVCVYLCSDKSYCGTKFNPKLKIVVSMIIVTILVKLLHMIWDYVTSFLMCHSVYLHFTF